VGDGLEAAFREIAAAADTAELRAELEGLAAEALEDLAELEGRLTSVVYRVVEPVFLSPPIMSPPN
jgi:hypothetical protein